MLHPTSLFSQILALISKHHFARACHELRSDRYAKGFSSWDQFVAMLFCQLAQAKSLREICDGLHCCLGKLNHLGIAKGPKRSTLSYANAHRPWQLYEATFYQLLERCRAVSKGKKRRFRFRNKLLSLDATVIDLCLAMFPWATFRQTKGAVKLHLLLDHDGYLPTFVHLTTGKVHEITVARRLPLPPGSIVVVDRGFTDYALFYAWHTAKVWFVTRQKHNAAYQVVGSWPLPKHRHIIADQLIRFTGETSRAACPVTLRRIVVWDPTKEEEIVLLTNHLTFGATTIAAIYKDRWEIEVFFRTLKQNLKVKTFVGTSDNALRIQIWAALIAILLVKYLQFSARLAWSFSNLVALLHWNLFSYRHLWSWLNDPFGVPPLPAADQLLFPFLDSIRLETNHA
ncbi:MAG: IS4 family transposase [Candidatus Eisenbacteria bacterium]|jgi:hypothetical protein|nr:IS4 family transposase [Candidatus Eisenbacteria bacterium]